MQTIEWDVLPYLPAPPAVSGELARLAWQVLQGRADLRETVQQMRALADVLETRSTDDLGAAVLRARRRRVPWKVLVKVYGRSRATLHRLARAAADEAYRNEYE